VPSRPALDQLVELTALLPDAPALRAAVDLDALAIAHDESGSGTSPGISWCAPGEDSFIRAAWGEKTDPTKQSFQDANIGQT
jgi:hypothetical protein